MKAKNKELLILIPGAKTPKPKWGFAERALDRFLQFVAIEKPLYRNYAIDWKEKFNKKNREIIWLHWGRGLTAISTWFASRRLKRIINEYKNTHRISIIGISLGGEIALQTINSLPKGTLDKVALVASINDSTKVHSGNVKVLNLYSKGDIFARMSTKIWAPIHGGMKLSGKNVTNIEINNFSHVKFCLDDKISSGKFAGKHITDIINSYLDKK